jgi:integrase
VRSGWPIDAVARQMGHIDGTLVMKVYGRFLPQQGDRDRWEAMATARDAERKELNAETSAV